MEKERARNLSFFHSTITRLLDYDPRRNSSSQSSSLPSPEALLLWRTSSPTIRRNVAVDVQLELRLILQQIIDELEAEFTRWTQAHPPTMLKTPCVIAG